MAAVEWVDVVGITVVLSHVSGPWTALTLATVVFLGTGIAVYVAAGDTARTARTVSAVWLAAHETVPSELHRTLQHLAHTLSDAEGRHRDGLMSKAEYEHTCWQVYDELAGERFVPANDPSSRQARTWASAATLADSYHR
ncbi:hypothetical protein LOC73_23380 [Mycolicibacterium mageritense]|nr:DUF6611 family protein [Mycolicibacterium mageritense]MCC9183578.1 hypothetical protein [Mycolicibacterium mageritense]